MVLKAEQKKDTEKKKNIRVDADRKVSAKAEFIEDVEFKNLLHGATVRSPVAHGRLRGIKNLERVKNMPGVRAVLTYKDIPGENVVPFVKEDYPCLASNKMKFYGQAVALVAAETPEQAKKAANAAELKYDELPGVYGPMEAMKPDALYVGGDDNIHSQFRIRKGDIDRGFANSDVTVEKVYKNRHQVHCYLENQGMVVSPTPNGGVAAYGSMQCPFYVHNALVKVTGMPYSKVRVVQSTTGGGFGGKEDVPSIVATHAGLLALKTGQPVRIIYDREEDFISMSKRHPARTRIKYGATQDGDIVACEAEFIVNGGAFCTLTPIVAWRGIIHITGPYEIPNVRADSYGMATNTVPCGALRGFGQPQANFANESLIDELAEKLDMDPVDLRKRNLMKSGSITATGQKVGGSCGMLETLDKSVDKIRFKRHNASDRGVKKRGMGVSTTFYGVGLGAEGKYFAKAGAQVYIKEDGSVFVAVGNVEMGQGAETVFNRICADTLGCSYDMVEVMEPDTTRVPDSGPTVASRATMVGGRAVMDAAKKVKKTLKEVAADMLDIKPYQVKIDRENHRYGTDSNSVDYIDVVQEAYARRERVAAQGWFKIKGVNFNQDDGQGDAYPVYTFSTNICEVEVDTETGEVDVTKFVAAHDIGKAIHPPSAEGQIQGGTVQAIGYALQEKLVLEEGIIQNPSFTGYTIPTTMDVCDVEPIIVESAYEEGPFGAKGLGEPPMVGPAAAVVNAIYDAVGVRVRKTPCLPEDILRKLRKKKKSL
ncbi:MAG: xanthine dehydrogenase family protein molybdopterin-binding subunit [Elusimicrobiota bacterium]